MTEGVARDQRTVRERAFDLLSVANSVKSEGWDDAVAAQLRRAARDLLGMADLLSSQRVPGQPDA